MLRENMNITNLVIERFFAKVKKTDSCWIWTGKRNNYNYGVSFIDKVEYGSHRISWMIHNHVILSSIDYVCHSCDNPPCVNPAHLWLGNAQKNCDDKIEKGRSNYAFGNRIALAKLDPKKVQKIRKMFETGNYSKRALGRIFGVSHTVICGVIKGTIWKEVV